MKEKKWVADMSARRYRQARQKEKTVILNEFVQVTGYGRSYARLVLRNQGRVVQVSRQVRVRGNVEKQTRRARCSYYDAKVVKVLVIIWRVMNYICGKRLAPVLGEMVELLVRRNELKCDAETQQKLAKMSASTIDRLLRPEPKKYQLKGRSHTKPGTLLKHQIPIRTFSEWDEQRPGFLDQ